MKKQKTPEDELYMVGIALFILGIPCLVAYHKLMTHFPELHMGCVLHALTGYYCPGCGGTRAVYALLRGQILRSFCYHPVVPYGAGVYLYFMLTHTIQRLSGGRWQHGMKYHPAYLWVALVILVVNVLVKNLVLLLFQVDLLAIPV
ncbi:MAG: DUF2752 domain-containing protein [bacterium]|nr:DUF2752 domain-containing protein [bacterium]